jgi:ABC-type proline/glycine betaine transport system ATPase subunit
MNYYKGLEEIVKTGEFKNIPTELIHDYISDFTAEFNSRSLIKKLNIAVVVRQSEQLLAYTEWLKKKGLLNATVSKLIVKRYQSK